MCCVSTSGRGERSSNIKDRSKKTSGKSAEGEDFSEWIICSLVTPNFSNFQSNKKCRLSSRLSHFGGGGVLLKLHSRYWVKNVKKGQAFL